MYNVLLYKQNADNELVLSNDSDLQTLRKGDNLFRDAEFTEWKSPLDCLTSGINMFYNSSLTSWKIELPMLSNGENMFTYSKITNFTSYLPLLKNGVKMFANTSSLNFFSEDMPRLENGEEMFLNSAIQHYSSFTKKLTNGKAMFKNCVNLCEFIGSLESLENGEEMFVGCSLSPASVSIIVDTIKKYPKKNITHTIDIGIDSADNFPAITKFATEAGYTNWSDLVKAFEDKGWQVNWTADGKEITSDKINVTKTYQLSDFPIIGIEEEVTLNGSFTISVKGTKNTYCKTTITVNDATLNGVPLSGKKENIIYIPFDIDGNMLEEKTFDILFSSIGETSMHLISATFKVIGWAEDIQVLCTTGGIQAQITEDFVYIDYNTDGKVTGYNLSRLENGEKLFYSNDNLTAFDGDLGKLTNGERMFYAAPLQSFETTDISSLTNGSYMFYNCSSLKNVKADFTKLTNGSYMFYYCPLTNSQVTFPILTSADYMFRSAGNSTYECTFEFPLLESASGMFYYTRYYTISCSFPKLTNGYHMFYCSQVRTFNSELPNLTSADYMFYNSSISELNTEFPKLTSGRYMFSYCYSLVNFDKTLNELIDGHAMFYRCKNLESFDVENLEKLTDGYCAFENTRSLTNFNTATPALTDGSYMFRRAWYTYESSTSWHGTDLSLSKYKTVAPLTLGSPVQTTEGEESTPDRINFDSLSTANYMFAYTQLENFNYRLPKLTKADGMFLGCCLNKESVLSIVDTLVNDTTNRNTSVITLGVNKDLQQDDELRIALGETTNQRDSQEGEKYPADYPQYIKSTLTNKQGGKWNITTYWY